MLSIHPGRICPPMQSEHSVLLGVLSLFCRIWKSLSVKKFKKSATTLKSIYRQPADTHSLVDSSFSCSEETAAFETSMIHHPGKHGGMATRRQTKSSHTLQGYTRVKQQQPFRLWSQTSHWLLSFDQVRNSILQTLSDAGECTKQTRSMCVCISVCCVYTTST